MQHEARGALFSDLRSYSNQHVIGSWSPSPDHDQAHPLEFQDPPESEPSTLFLNLKTAIVF